jgi:hypothetical protein
MIMLGADHQTHTAVRGVEIRIEGLMITRVVRG